MWPRSLSRVLENLRNEEWQCPEPRCRRRYPSGYRRAILEELVARLKGAPGDLLSFDEVQQNSRRTA
jgi:hypothetical protein